MSGDQRVKIWEISNPHKVRKTLFWQPDAGLNSLPAPSDKFVLSLEKHLKVNLELRITRIFFDHLLFKCESDVEIALQMPLSERITRVWWTCSLYGCVGGGLKPIDIAANNQLLAKSKCTINGRLHYGVQVQLQFLLTENQSSFDRLGQGLKNLRDTQTLTDVVLVCEGQEFHCHKNVLAAQSPVFHAMLASDSFKEARKGVVTLVDITPAHLKIMLDFLYTKTVEQLEDNIDNAMALLSHADQYDLPELVEACIAILESCISTENVFDIINLASAIKVPSLKKAAVRYMMVHGHNILKSDLT